MTVKCETPNTENFKDFEGTIITLRERLFTDKSESLQCARALDDLAVALSRGFTINKELSMLEEATELHQQALQLLKPEDPLRNTFLQHYVDTLRQLKELLTNGVALPSAIQHFRATLHVRPPGHPLRDTTLNHLGVALWLDYEQCGDDALLEEASCLLQEALELRPLGHPLRDVSLQNLSSVACYQDKLAEAEYLLRATLALRPVGHPLRDVVLNNLATVLNRKRESNFEDTTEIEELHRQSLVLRPQGHPLRDSTLANLASVLCSQFRWTFGSEKLDEAVALSREALSLRPSGHYRRGETMAILADCLWYRFEYYGNERDRVDAMTLAREAVGVCPPGNLFRVQVVDVLACLYNENGQHAEAALLYRELVASLAPQERCRSSFVQHLANSLLDLSRVTGSLGEIMEATSYYNEVLQSRTIDHPHYACAMGRYARALHAYFMATSDICKREEAITFYRRAFEVEAQTNSHLEKAEILHHLARILLTFDSTDSWNEALQRVTEASSINIYAKRNILHLMSSTVIDMEAALMRMNDQDGQYSRGALDIYIQAVKLLPQAAHFGLDLSSRLRELTGLGHLCHVTAIRALLLNRAPVAIEVLEEGRALFWMQSMCLRSTPLDAIPPSDADTLRELLIKLERGSRILGSDEVESKTELDHLLAEQQSLNNKVHRMVQEIRARPGMETFMSIEPFDRLIQSAAHGPVVLLVATDTACFAVVLLDTQGNHHSVPLQGVTPKELHNLRNRTQGSGLCGRGSKAPLEEETGERLGIGRRSRALPTDESFSVLAEIWRTIMKPIVESLTLKRASGRDRPRIHWCPVGEFAFLPLHAAGIYTGEDQIRVSDFFVSSYAPSLSSLIQTHKNFESIQRSELKALLIAESTATNHSVLIEVKREVEVVSALLEAACVQHHIDVTPTVEAVLENLPTAHFVHIACHGLQQPNALESYFALHDGQLSIAALTKVQLSNAVLAFLSACETAKGDQHQPDQAVHLAASMLFCGFRSVIGTMWAMNDKDGPRVAKATYSALLSRETITLDDIPYALDSAIEELRREGVPPSRWATFIHMGA